MKKIRHLRRPSRRRRRPSPGRLPISIVAFTATMTTLFLWTNPYAIRLVRPFVLLSPSGRRRPFRWSHSSSSSSSSSPLWHPTRLGLVPSCEEFLQERRSNRRRRPRPQQEAPADEIRDDDAVGGGGGGDNKIVLSYLTDVEGDKAYLDRYVETSKVLKFVPTASARSSSSVDDHEEDEDRNDHLPYPFPYDRRIDFVDDHSMLVFGGDLWDKGGYDLYVTRQLLDLKRRHPTRCLWVLGNRDINKLRMLQELGLTGRQTMPHHPGLTWFRNSGRVGDPDGPLPSEEPGERLAWILSQTMGSPDAMEHRRNELAWERRGCPSENLDRDEMGTREAAVTDLDVVRSYQESCHPKGELGLFLQQAYLAARVGPVLFVHGSLPLTPDVVARAKEESKSVWDDLSFCQPWLTSEEREKNTIDKIEDWLDALNLFCHNNLELWKEDIAQLEINERETRDPKDAIWAYRAGYHNGPPYSGLIQYGMGRIPNGQKNPTVVYNTFTPEGMPASFFPPPAESDVATSTREFFDRSGIQIILTGHKPQGDSPSPIRISDSSWVICADTSYSGDTMWWHQDASMGSNVTTAVSKRRTNLGRGKSVSFRGEVAVSEVLVEILDDGNTLKSVRYHGVLSDGTEYESVNLLDAASQNTTVGQVAPIHLVPTELDSPHQGRWWTKSIFSDGSQLFHAGEGFNVWNYVAQTEKDELNEEEAAVKVAVSDTS